MREAEGQVAATVAIDTTPTNSRGDFQTAAGMAIEANEQSGASKILEMCLDETIATNPGGRPVPWTTVILRK